MKNQIKILALLFLLSCNSKSIKTKGHSDICKFEYNTALRMNVYTVADKMPLFPNGLKNLNKFLYQNLVFMEDTATLQGSLKLSFIVDTQGNLVDKKIVGKTEDKYTMQDKEGLRVLAIMPKWIPAECDSKKVAFRYILPIKF